MNIFDRIAIYNQLMDEKKEKAKEEAKKNKLKRDAKGKPIIELTALEKTVVHIPTQQDYDTLMQVYECGGWRCSEFLPTSLDWWDRYKREMCIVAKKILEYSPKCYFQSERWKILSTQEFYNKQNITKEMINQIKDYFKDKK